MFGIHLSESFGERDPAFSLSSNCPNVTVLRSHGANPRHGWLTSGTLCFKLLKELAWSPDQSVLPRLSTFEDVQKQLDNVLQSLPLLEKMTVTISHHFEKSIQERPFAIKSTSLRILDVSNCFKTAAFELSGCQQLERFICIPYTGEIYGNGGIFPCLMDQGKVVPLKCTKDIQDLSLEKRRDVVFLSSTELQVNSLVIYPPHTRWESHPQNHVLEIPLPPARDSLDDGGAELWSAAWPDKCIFVGVYMYGSTLRDASFFSFNKTTGELITNGKLLKS